VAVQAMRGEKRDQIDIEAIDMRDKRNLLVSSLQHFYKMPMMER